MARMSPTPHFTAALLFGLLCPLPLLAQAVDASGPARVMVLGVYHFGNPGLDVVKSEVADVLSPDKQAEILAVVEELARFRPTVVAVEQRPASSARFDSLYDSYLAGRHTLSRNETEQLGFRLAAGSGLSGVHPIDHPGDFPFGELMSYAQDHDLAFVEFVEAERARMEEEDERRQRDLTVGEILRLDNEPESLARSHALYLRFARVGAADTYVGAELLSRWYERNIHIFTNIQRLAGPGDRVLVIIGAGHAPILRQLISADPAMQLVDTVEYLPAS